MAEKNPVINNDDFFAALDEIQIVQRESYEGYPWEHAAEDRYAAELCIASLYEAHKLPPPRAYSWARSPRSMWGAITMLRQFQAESRQKVVEGLVPLGNPVETEAKRVLLDTVMDRTLTVTLGGNLRDKFTMGHNQMRRSLMDLKTVLSAQMIRPKGLSVAGFHDMTMWPLEKLPSQFFHLHRQAIVMAPFIHCVFLSRPPIFIKTDDHGYLHCDDGPAVRFEDGYEIWVTREEEEAQDALPSGDTLALPEETS